MAIYPVQSNYIIDVDIITTTSFKAGMVLMRDDNGRAIPADNQTFYSKTLQQKSAKFLGFAASDHDVSGLTIIEPDVISSSWLDNNKNFQRFENVEVSHVRRSIAEHLDPNYTLDNPSYNPTVYKRGIGVYNQQGEIYITDQFSPTYHGDFGVDSMTVVAINPGDLLTFGGGINAGKLVKVNPDSGGPDVLVVAIVEKYIPETGLLHFRQVNYGVSFTPVSYVAYYDPASSVSYPKSGASVFDLSGNGYTGTLTAGITFSTNNLGSFAFDGVSGSIQSYSIPSTFWTGAGGSWTFEVWVNSNNTVSGDYGICGTAGQLHILQRGFAPSLNFFANDLGGNKNLIMNKWTQLVFTYNSITFEKQIYQNGTLDTSAIQSVASISGANTTFGKVPWGYNWWKGSFGLIKLSQRIVTATEVLNSYNFQKTRYGL